MNLLREYIRKLLKEGAKDITDLESNDLYVTIKQDPDEAFGTQAIQKEHI